MGHRKHDNAPQRLRASPASTTASSSRSATGAPSSPIAGSFDRRAPHRQRAQARLPASTPAAAPHPKLLPLPPTPSLAATAPQQRLSPSACRPRPLGRPRGVARTCAWRSRRRRSRADGLYGGAVSLTSAAFIDLCSGRENDGQPGDAASCTAEFAGTLSQDQNPGGGVAQMVERSLSMREVRGSIPRTSNLFFASHNLHCPRITFWWPIPPVAGCAAVARTNGR